MSGSTDYSTGAKRSISEGRGRYDLIPAQGMGRVALVAEEGAKLYGDNNWQKGIPLHRYVDSAMRHIQLYLSGNRQEDHVARAAWNLLALGATEIMILNGEISEEMDTLGHIKAVLRGLEDVARFAAGGAKEEVEQGVPSTNSQS